MSRNFIYRSTADGIYFRVDKLYRARKKTRRYALRWSFDEVAAVSVPASASVPSAASDR